MKKFSFTHLLLLPSIMIVILWVEAKWTEMDLIKIKLLLEAFCFHCRRIGQGGERKEILYFQITSISVLFCLLVTYRFESVFDGDDEEF